MNFSELLEKTGRLRKRVAMALAFPALVSGIALPVSLAQASTTGGFNENSSQSTQVIDAIAAVVNSEIITAQELRDRVVQVEQRLRRRGMPVPPESELRRQSLEQMILERAQLQMAREQGIRVDDAALDRAVARIAEQNGLNVQQLRDQVERDGTPFPRFREIIREEIVMQRLREREVANKIKISESEIDNYLAAHADAMARQGQEMHLAQILIRVPENASPEQLAQSRRRAETVVQQLKSGADFNRVASEYSDADASDTDLGWRRQDRLPQLFLDAVAALRPGEVSSIVRSGNGFHILKLVGLRGGASKVVPAVQQTRVRHILIKVNQVVSAEEARRRLVDLKQRLENNAARFEELARLYSSDLSASAGGDLGWIYPGDTVPEFERAMNALKPGEISDPVESPFGYHLIQVVERRVEDVPETRMRMAARQEIYERKMQEATEEWLRELRDRAYVEYRMDITSIN